MPPAAPLRPVWHTALARMLAGLLVAALAPVATAQAQGGAKGKPQAYADPADVLSANFTFLRLARAKGLAAAVKATAADGAMIVPGARLQWPSGAQPTPVPDFLAHATTYGAPQWPVQQVWMSCDGATAVTAGALDSHATGITVWQRQNKGGYKWVLHLDGMISGLPAPAPANPASPDDAIDAPMIGASVADCPAHGHHGGLAAPVAANPPVPAAGDLAGTAADGTLMWAYEGENRSFTLRLKQDGDWQAKLAAVGSIMPPTPAPMPPSAQPSAHP